MSELFDLSGQVAVVTGGCGFLGAGFCRALARAGARVVAVDLLAPAASGAARAWAKLPAGAVAHRAADITDPAQVAELVAWLEAEYGGADLLVNGAAIDPKFEASDKARLKEQQFTHFRLSDWEEALRVNLTGTFLITQGLCRLFERKNRGNVINIASMYGLIGPDQRIYNQSDDRIVFVKPPTYTVTKAGLLGFTRYLATYYMGRNIRVNAISPGGIERDHEAEFIRKYSARTVLGRMGRPEDLHGALVFLASDASAYMTGANLVVDGGWTAL